MESSSEETHQEKKDEKPVLKSSFLADLSVSSSSSSGNEEERPRLSSCKVKEAWDPPHSSTIKASTPKTNNSNICNFTSTEELQEPQAKAEDPKAASRSREIQDPKLVELESSDTDQEVGGMFLN